MKKIIGGVFVFMFILSIVGCGKEQEYKNTEYQTYKKEENTKLSKNFQSKSLVVEENNIAENQASYDLPYIPWKNSILGKDATEYERKSGDIFVSIDGTGLVESGYHLVDDENTFYFIESNQRYGVGVNQNTIVAVFYPGTRFIDAGIKVRDILRYDDCMDASPKQVVSGMNIISYIWRIDEGYLVIDVFNAGGNSYLDYYVSTVTVVNDICYNDLIDSLYRAQNEELENNTHPENAQSTNANSDVSLKSSDLEQALFDSINYSLSIGTTNNCDMSQDILKKIYDKVEDGSFFEETMFSFVNEYGKERYNYEISYDSLVVIIYHDSIEDMYGFEILEH